jgi:hypothetical protein
MSTVFQFKVDNGGMPQPRCPQCKKEVHALQARVIEGNAITGEKDTTIPTLTKMIHTCPHCYCILGLTDY